MRCRRVFSCSALFIIFLSATFSLTIQKPTGYDLKASSLLIGNRGDIKSFPGRNSGLSRRSRVTSIVPLSLKSKAGMEISNVLLCASYIILLAGDVSSNP